MTAAFQTRRLVALVCLIALLAALCAAGGSHSQPAIPIPVAIALALLLLIPIHPATQAGHPYSDPFVATVRGRAPPLL